MSVVFNNEASPVYVRTHIVVDSDFVPCPLLLIIIIIIIIIQQHDRPNGNK